MKENYKPIK